MKIVNQNQESITLSDGNMTGIIVGIVFFLASIGIDYSFYSDHTHPGFSNMMWIGVGIFVFGIIAILTSTSIIVEINKSSNQIVYKTKRMIGSRQKNYNISDVLRVETRRTYNMVANGRQGLDQVLLIQSVILFKNGEEIPLDSSNSAGGANFTMGPSVLMAGSGKEMVIANQVATFMGVPFQEINPPSDSTKYNLGPIHNIQL
jgi:hypothetical protein